MKKKSKEPRPWVIQGNTFTASSNAEANEAIKVVATALHANATALHALANAITGGSAPMIQVGGAE